MKRLHIFADKTRCAECRKALPPESQHAVLYRGGDTFYLDLVCSEECERDRIEHAVANDYIGIATVTKA